MRLSGDEILFIVFDRLWHRHAAGAQDPLCAIRIPPSQKLSIEVHHCLHAHHFVLQNLRSNVWDAMRQGLHRGQSRQLCHLLFNYVVLRVEFIIKDETSAWIEKSKLLVNGLKFIAYFHAVSVMMAFIMYWRFVRS